MQSPVYPIIVVEKRKFRGLPRGLAAHGDNGKTVYFFIFFFPRSITSGAPLGETTGAPVHRFERKRENKKGVSCTRTSSTRTVARGREEHGRRVRSVASLNTPSDARPVKDVD